MNRQGASHQYLTLIMWLCLLTTLPIFAKPRPAAPPMPESHLQLWRFDTAAEFTGTNKSPADVHGVTSSESWSGYSLRVAGDKPARIAFPEINAAGKTNLAFNHGAVRLWFRGDWSSAGLGGKGPSSDARLLSLHSAAKARVIERALVFDPSGDSLYCADVNGEQLLQARISWPAGSWHQVVLNYSATGTALFLDGALVAKGQGVTAWPKTAERFFTIGSDANGENLAQGEFEEFTTFTRNLTPEEIAANYRACATVAQLGPITPEEEAAKKEHQAKLIAARKSGAMQMSLAPPGGGGGGGTNGAGGGYSYLTAQTGLRLVDPAWQSNVFTATIAGGEEGGRYDLFFTTNLNVSNAWSFVTRTAPGQTNLLVAPADQGFFMLGTMLDADGDTLTDAYEALVSKTDPAAFTSYASTGGTGALAAVLFDEPAVVRISQVNIYEEFAPHCPVIPSLVPAAGNTTDLNWAWGQGGSTLSNLWFLNCPGNGHIGSFYAQTLWNSNDVASCETWYAGQSHIAGTNCSAPPTNFPAEYCLIAAAAGDNTFVRTAATAVELVTGGPKFSLNSNLFLIHYTATERTNTPLTGGGITIGLKATNITFTDITVLGQPLNTNGDLFIALADWQTNNITPVLSTNYSNYVFTPTITKAKLKILQGGTNITEVTKTMWVGQEMKLTCELDPPIATVTNFLWTIPGNVISNYVANATSGTLYALTNAADFTNSIIKYYWIDGSGASLLGVECTVIVKGVTITAKTKFQVKAATGRLFSIIVDQINLYTNEQAVFFGKTNGLGIGFQADNLSPTVLNPAMECSNAIWAIVQIASDTRRKYIDTNDLKWGVITNGLDTEYPRKTQAVTNSGQFILLCGDAPFGGLMGAKAVWRSDSFSEYLMFNPNTTNSIPVPVKRTDWFWSFSATNLPPPVLLSTNFGISTADAVTTTHPKWNFNITNSIPTTNGWYP